MYDRHQNAYYAAELASFLKKELTGENIVVYEPRSVNSVKNNSMIFVDNVWCKDFQYHQLRAFSEVLVITNEDIRTKTQSSFIVTPEPRLDFIRLLNQFFLKKPAAEIEPSAVVDKRAVVGKNVSIGANSFIGPDVTIGDETVIQQNVVISGKVSIGKRCVIKANATIGSEGFSFIFDKDHLEHFPQIGGIVIGDDVWIGANATVERAALDDTVIEEGVKVDDLVQIGHNARIGRFSQITAGAVICGRAVLGERCWVAPNACIDNAVVIGKNSLIGMGSVVLKDVPEAVVVAGVPAKILRKNNLKQE